MVCSDILAEYIQGRCWKFDIKIIKSDKVIGSRAEASDGGFSDSTLDVFVLYRNDSDHRHEKV